MAAIGAMPASNARAELAPGDEAHAAAKRADAEAFARFHARVPAISRERAARTSSRARPRSSVRPRARGARPRAPGRRAGAGPRDLEQRSDTRTASDRT
jgi:hypothetical protein